MFGCVLPDDADIVLGFVKVAGGSGLLSMIVPTAERPFIAINLRLCRHYRWTRLKKKVYVLIMN